MLKKMLNPGEKPKFLSPEELKEYIKPKAPQEKRGEAVTGTELKHFEDMIAQKENELSMAIDAVQNATNENQKKVAMAKETAKRKELQTLKEMYERKRGEYHA